MDLQSTSSILLEELQERGLIAQSTDLALLAQHLQRPLNFYCGFDPTGESLHVGHLLLIVLSQHLQRAGHRPFFVIGGATGRIGDPSFKGKERELTQLEVLNDCALKLEAQFRQWFNFSESSCSAKILNNFEWTHCLDVLTFLRDIGKYFSVNSMLQKDAIKQRIERAEVGISYTEFSYVLLQAHDYWHLHREHQVTLQLGGSDQWGNIVAGINLIAQKNRQQVHGLTVPLITKNDGSKFGKTESGVVWLCKDKTSPYHFYQFWFNTPDEAVLSYLKKFTFIPLSELKCYEDLSQHAPNSAQKRLAHAMTAWIHGESITEEIERINECLFQGAIGTLDKSALQLSSLPKISAQQEISLIKALKETRLCSSAQEAKRQIEQGAISVNDLKVGSDLEILTKTRHCLPNGHTILKKGKKNYALIFWELLRSEIP